MHREISNREMGSSMEKRRLPPRGGSCSGERFISQELGAGWRKSFPDAARPINHADTMAKSLTVTSS